MGRFAPQRPNRGGRGGIGGRGAATLAQNRGVRGGIRGRGAAILAQNRGGRGGQRGDYRGGRGDAYFRDERENREGGVGQMTLVEESK